jgi:HAD superfamily hydrolase (TIGR01509 family)
MPDKRFEAVIFDFGNVICSFSVDSFINGLSQKAGKSKEQLMRVMPGINKLAVEYETGLVTSDEFFVRLCSLAGITISRDDFVHAYTDIFFPIDGTYALIRELKPLYKLGLLSNTNEWHYLHSIRPVEVYALFDVVTLSYEVKAMKPARAIYADMLQKLDLPAERCVYIDDLHENIVAAAKLGLHAIHFTGSERLRSELQSLGVLAG